MAVETWGPCSSRRCLQAPYEEVVDRLLGAAGWPRLQRSFIDRNEERWSCPARGKTNRFDGNLATTFASSETWFTLENGTPASEADEIQAFI